jgi:hypothetical protein
MPALDRFVLTEELSSEEAMMQYHVGVRQRAEDGRYGYIVVDGYGRSEARRGGYRSWRYAHAAGCVRARGIVDRDRALGKRSWIASGCDEGQAEGQAEGGEARRG